MSKKATTNTHLHCKSLQTFVTILWNIRSCSSLKVKGKQNTFQMNMTYISYSYCHFMKITALSEFELFHEWQTCVVHTCNSAMPYHCFVLYSGEGMFHFCVSFKPTGDLKVCGIWFLVLLNLIRNGCICLCLQSWIHSLTSAFPHAAY